MVASVACVLISVLPGLMVHWPQEWATERARPSALGATGAAAPAVEAVASTSTSTPTSTSALPPSTTAPPSEVAIVPPTEPMSGPVAAAASGPTARPFRYAATGAGGSDVLALIVGIDDYPGSRYDLDAAVADAETIDSALAGFGVPVTNRAILRDGQATRANLIAALEDLVARADEATTVVFAYAGHVQKLDGDTEAIVTARGEHLTDSELAALLAPARSQRMWILMASCYAAGFDEVLAPGRILTAASGADEVAYESPTLNGSYLVHHMVREGWLDRRAGTSVQEAFAYADAVISSRYPSRRPVQIDRAGTLRFSGSTATAAPYRPPSPSGPSSPTTTMAPTTTSTAPERRCTLFVLC